MVMGDEVPGERRQLCDPPPPYHTHALSLGKAPPSGARKGAVSRNVWTRHISPTARARTRTRAPHFRLANWLTSNFLSAF